MDFDLNFSFLLGILTLLPLLSLFSPSSLALRSLFLRFPLTDSLLSAASCDLCSHCIAHAIPPRRLSSASYSPPPTLLPAAVYTLRSTLFPTPLPPLLLVANCVVYRFVAVVVVFVPLLLCFTQLFLCISTTLSTRYQHPLLMQLRCCPHFPWLFYS